MEVTSSNFNELLPEIEAAIGRSTFLAIDCEFSGLNVVSQMHAFDTPKEYYEKMIKNCRDFLVLQYGVSAFRFDATDGCFKQQSYNFYIFRRPVNNNIPDQRFLCQTSSINFLTTQGFDFNKLFKCGIPYLNITEENDCRDKLEERRKVRSNQLLQQSPAVVPIPSDLKPTIDGVLKQLGEFLEGESEELELPKCTAFVRRLIYQSTASKYRNKIVLQTKQKGTKDRVLVATKYKGKTAQDLIEKKMQDEELTALEDFIGFTKVLRMIVDSGKLVVGHNMCLDFLHTIDKFLTPLSSNYDEFKECAHSLFGSIIDTKFVAGSDEFKELISSTILKDLFDSVSKKPFQMPPLAIEDGGQGYTVDDSKEHEAGYDAYITGLCLISMWRYLGKQQKLSLEDTFKDTNVLAAYLNKLCLTALRDNQYINLGGDDPITSRDHVFYLTFPSEWKLNNITELFSPFGGVYVSWLDQSSAYVSLFKREQAAVALSTLSQSDTYSIMTYSRRQMAINSKASPSTVTQDNKRKNAMELTPKNTKKIKSDCFPLRTFAKKLMKKDEGTSQKVKKQEDKPKTFVESTAWE